MLRGFEDEVGFLTRVPVQDQLEVRRGVLGVALLKQSDSGQVYRCRGFRGEGITVGHRLVGSVGFFSATEGIEATSGAVQGTAGQIVGEVTGQDLIETGDGQLVILHFPAHFAQSEQGAGGHFLSGIGFGHDGHRVDSPTGVSTHEAAGRRQELGFGVDVVARDLIGQTVEFGRRMPKILFQIENAAFGQMGIASQAGGGILVQQTLVGDHRRIFGSQIFVANPLQQ